MGAAVIADRIPEHLEVAAGLAVLAEELASSRPDMAARLEALAARLGYQFPRHELDIALAQRHLGVVR